MNKQKTDRWKATIVFKPEQPEPPHLIKVVMPLEFSAPNQVAIKRELGALVDSTVQAVYLLDVIDKTNTQEVIYQDGKYEAGWKPKPKKA